MPTLKEIVDDILTTWEGGRRSSNGLPDRNYIIFKILEYRALYIRRDVEKNLFISNQIEQDLGCLDLEDVDAADCCDVEIGCTVKRTVDTIPTTIRFNYKDAITYVGSIDKTTSFKIIRPYDARWAKFNKYTNKGNRAYLLNDKLYVISGNPLLDKINVRGVFYDPRDVRPFICDGEPCYTENSIFPIGTDMLQSIVTEIVSKDLRLGVTDTINNMVDDKTIRR